MIHSLRHIIITTLLIMASASLHTFAHDLPVVAVIDNRTLDVTHIAKSLHSRLSSALSSAGIHSEGEEGLYLVGELIPVSEETVETGMRKIKILKFELSLRLEQPMLNLQFGQTTIPLEGSGYDSTKAAMDAVRNFNPSASGIQDFISESVRKADEYYISHIDAIIDKAEMLAKGGNYDEAIALLWGCPNSNAIHTKTYAALDRIYLARQNHDCSMLMKKAHAAYAIKDYDEMKLCLEEIDADSNCASEAIALAKKAGVEIRKEEREAFDRQERSEARAYAAMEKDRDRRHELEKQRISAISGIAKAYAQSHRSTYHYHIF